MSDSAPFVLVSAETVCQLCAGDSGSAVEIALRDLARDVEKITGRRLETAAAPERDAVIIRIDPAAFGEAPEAYTLRSRPGNVLEITGSDELGAIFGIYRFSEVFLGVDPFQFWNGRAPRERDTLAWENIDLAAPAPKFRFRG